jgi:hypothetical protein
MSPERKSVRARFWMRVGQLVGEALRAWRRDSWILGGLAFVGVLIDWVRGRVLSV